MQTALFLAMEGERAVARCAALINPAYQAAKNEQVGFIGYFCAAPGSEQNVAAMLKVAEDWLKKRGIQRVIAPYNGSALLGYGVLSDGFEAEPVMMCSWNPPYYPALFTSNAYRPTYPMLVYTFDFASAEYRAAKAQSSTQPDLKIRPIDKKHWEAELDIFRTVTNSNFTGEWLWHPLSQAEFSDFFEVAKVMIDPQQMLVAEVDGKPAGIMIGFPNWNPMVRGFQGRAGILQKLIFLLRGRKVATAGVIIAAVQPEFRGRGIGPMLELAVLQRYEQLGLKKAYCYTVDEDNLASRRMNEAAGGVPRLMYHAYDKLLELG
jgi:GNAT superfamily N-acetyltransferase